MKDKKIHLRGLSNTLCGIKDSVYINYAKKWKEVNCKRCMKTWEYKKYLTGKFKDKS